MNTNNNFYGVDRTVVELAMRRARRERALALGAIVRRIFNREDAGDNADVPAEATTTFATASQK